ncbi:MAG: LysR family transcriptional regulator [Paracoccaceae bacterium]
MFIEAAERASFAAAAEALNVTQAAVSKQMAGLETKLGTVLFERAHRSVTVTAAGRSYLPIAKRVVALLEAGLEEASALPSRRTLRIEIDYEFFDLVVAPRLARLQQEIPRTDFTFIPSVPGRHAPLSDFAITFGHPRAGTASVARLCSFMVFPVVSPLLIEGVSDPFRTLPLLHDFDTYWWDTFLRAQGVVRADQGVVMGNGALAIRAAIAGQGIAIGDDILCADALRGGGLVRMGETKLPGRHDYWFSENPNMIGDAVGQQLRTWLETEITAAMGVQ